jgi:hypothetical protein
MHVFRRSTTGVLGSPQLFVSKHKSRVVSQQLDGHFDESTHPRRLGWATSVKEKDAGPIDDVLHEERNKPA